VPDATAVGPASGDDAKFASNPANFEADRAAGNNDQRHRLVLSGYWDMSYFKDSNGLVKVLLDGWSMSWIAYIQSGQPYSQLVTNDLNNDGNNRNDIVPGSRNSIYLPSNKDVDLRLSRRFPLGAKARLEIIAEAFNLLNHTNITSQQSVFYNYDPRNNILIPQQNLTNPRLNFGADSGALDPRIVQLAAKLTF
jgi:hypothetical protein